MNVIKEVAVLSKSKPETIYLAVDILLKKEEEEEGEEGEDETMNIMMKINMKRRQRKEDGGEEDKGRGRGGGRWCPVPPIHVSSWFMTQERRK